MSIDSLMAPVQGLDIAHTLIHDFFAFRAIVNGEGSFSDIHPQGHGMLVLTGLFILTQRDLKRFNAGGTLWIVERLLQNISRLVLKTDRFSRDTTFIVMGH